MRYANDRGSLQQTYWAASSQQLGSWGRRNTTELSRDGGTSLEKLAGNVALYAAKPVSSTWLEQATRFFDNNPRVILPPPDVHSSISKHTHAISCTGPVRCTRQHAMNTTGLMLHFTNKPRTACELRRRFGSYGVSVSQLDRPRIGFLVVLPTHANLCLVNGYIRQTLWAAC